MSKQTKARRIRAQQFELLRDWGELDRQREYCFKKIARLEILIEKSGCRDDMQDLSNAIHSQNDEKGRLTKIQNDLLIRISEHQETLLDIKSQNNNVEYSDEFKDTFKHVNFDRCAEMQK